MTDPAIPGLTRHYVTVGERQVHYRRMGSGPPLVMLHRLPRSSRDLIPMMKSAAEAGFTAIAPDLAGYGNSWQLFISMEAGQEQPPAITEYVKDMEDALAEMGLKRYLLYGEREGAVVAMQLAMRNKKGVAAVALNALTTTLTEVERAEARESYPAFKPRWDGSHLAWLWAYLRDETCFQPWWIKSLANRQDNDMPSAEELQSRVIQFLAEGRNPFDNIRHASSGARRTYTTGRLGRGYARGLIAMLDFRPIPHLANLETPTLITGRPAFKKDIDLARISKRSAKCEVKQAESFDDARRASIDYLKKHADGVPAAPPSPPAKPIPGALWSDFITVSGGQVHAAMNDDTPSVPVIVQHDAASSIGIVESIARSFVGRRTVLAFDMPGSGQSDNTLGYDGIEVEHYAEAIREVLGAIGLEEVDFYGMWGGGFVGLEMALKEPKQIRRLVMSNVFQHSGEERQRFLDNYTPDVSPVWHGGHLLQYWHQMRDQGLFYPWFESNTKGIIKREPHIDPNMIHQRVCALMKAGNMYRTAYQAHFRYPTYDKLKDCTVPLMLGTTKWDPNAAHTEAAAKAAPKNAQLKYFDEDFAKWGESFLSFLEAATV